MEYMLNLAPVNTPLKISKITENNKAMQLRMSQLGLVVNQVITLISKPTKHNVLVNIRGSIFALDNFLACKVVVHG